METKTRSPIWCSSCCVDDVDDSTRKVLEFSDAATKHHHNLAAWLKSELPELKEKCASIFSGKTGKNRHRGNAAEFRYDPLSYALNFEDGDSRIDQYPLRNFSATLPSSPPSDVKKNVAVSREIAAWS